MSGFNPQAGQAGKQLGMARAQRACNPVWWSFMAMCVTGVARRRELFTTDDLEWVRQTLNGPSTPEKRALGPLMKWAEGQDICEPTDMWLPSSQYACHRRPMRVWRSKIYQRTPTRLLPPSNGVSQ